MRRNLLAGLVSSVGSAVIGLAVVPIYLQYLGLEAYGLVGILASAQVLFSLLDLGMSPAMNREVARGHAEGNLQEARELLHTLSCLYVVTAVALAALTALMAPFIAQHWLQSTQLPQETVRHALILIGLVIACRWPVGLYLGVLIGAQRVVLSSGLSLLMTALGSLGAVAVLAYGAPRIEIFFLWQAIVALLYALTMRRAAWQAIGRKSGLRFSRKSISRIWRFSAGLSGIAVCALLLTQIDKVILSRLLSLSKFGEYALATLVASGVYLLITPVFNVIYPRFTALVSANSVQELTELYRKGTRLFASVLFPLAMLLALFAEDFVRVWTGSSQLAASIAPVIALFAIGSALHGVMYFPYALQLASGKARLSLTIAASLVAIDVPLTAWLAWEYGIEGGAAAWVVLHSLHLILGTSLTHRTLLIGSGLPWLTKDVGLPLAVSLGVGAFGASALGHGDWTAGAKLWLALGLLSAAWSALVVIMSKKTLVQLFRSLQASAAG